MSCAICGRTNPAIARFCAGCGKPLAARCPACGAENEGDARFCIACGAPLAARPAAGAEKADARKVVTIVFADLIGSTSLHERLDPESVSRVMERYHAAVRAAVEAHGGTVMALLGDGVMSAFGVPQVAEDDAIRAVRAAVGIQEAFREFAREHAEVLGNAGLRVAVNTGEVVVSDDYAAGIGDPLNVAARLQQEAHDGDVLIGESTQRLVSELVTLAPFGVLALKGRSETVTAYRVVSLERPAGASATPFVGRDAELRRLMAVYESAVATPTARLAVVLGSPGLGKSRLLDELGRRFAAATLLTASCEAAIGATFAPIARALRTHLHIDDGTAGDELRAAIEAAVPGDDVDRGRIAAGIAALLAGAPASPEETFFVIRRLLGRLAAIQPVVLAIDDLHWAEPLLLDLLEHLVQWSTDAPLLLLVAARPELREVRSALATSGGIVAEVVTLSGLDAGAATRLAANVIGADELPAAVAGRVLATSEGNPLFVGELVRMLVHDGALKREGDRWTAGVELAALEMPPTIQALLAARIERLRPEERTVLERAAIVGRQFSRAAVTHLLPREVADLDARLEALRRSELIEPDTGWFLGEPALRFHHVLIRDAAYRRVLKGTRAELHGRFADWLESRVGEAVEHDETIGWHLEQAHQHLRELGPVDAQGRALGERAARYLGGAGKRALARDDLPVAADLLGRALHLLDEADPKRADLTLDWCEALLAAGDVERGRSAIDELGRFAAAPPPTARGLGGYGVTGLGATKDRDLTPNPLTPNPRLSAWHTCFAGELAALTDPQSLRATADAVAAAAEVLAAAGDDAGEAKAHSVHASALARLGKVGACEAALDRALAAARRGDDRRRSNAVLAGAPLAALWGPSPVTRASGRCLDVVRVLRITQGAPAVEAVALRCQGVLEALRGRTEAARRMIASSRAMVEELGITHRLLEADVFAGLIELLEGEAVAAEGRLRPAYDGLRRHGLRIDAAQAAALLGRALLLQDRAAEAEALSHESEALAGDDLQAAIAWRGVRAEALARRGEVAAAVDFALAAVDLAATTDALLHHADARLALAAALRAAGRGDEAAAEEARAIELWEAKGATLLAERARPEAGLVDPVSLVPVVSTGAAPATNRRVRANAATANLVRLDAAIAARDAGAFPALYADEMQTMVQQLPGGAYDREGVLATWRSLLSAQAPTCHHEPLATLGDSLVLCQQSVSASGFAGRTFDVGAYAREMFGLIEVDSNGRQQRAEYFAVDRLGDAVVRLYERYVELLPDGPARDRAAATAGAMAALLGPPDRWPFVPEAEATDHRTVGFGSVRGGDAVLRAIRALLQLSDDFATRIDDVVGLRCDALLVRWTSSGTVHASGGVFERNSLMLWVFGADGLLTRWEQFDSDRVAEALARFDDLILSPSKDLSPEPSRRVEGLTAEPLALWPVRRSVRANAATALMARLDAAIAARDAEALSMLLGEDAEVIDHATGATFDQEGWTFTWRALMRARNPRSRHEPLATFGESLALFHLTTSASGFAGTRFDVGAYLREEIIILEVDGRGHRRSENFPSDRLGDAVARLYERFAEILPEGPARERIAATARSLAVLLLRTFDPDRWAMAFTAATQGVDHRTLGTFSAHGAALLQHVRSWVDVAADTTIRTEEVLGLRTDALLARWTFSGTDRLGGGAFERPYIVLLEFGGDGLLTRIEWFDVDRDAQALARFDELMEGPKAAAAPVRRVRANAATAHAARLDAAIAAGDADALPTLVADRVEIMQHLTSVTYDRQGLLASWRYLLRAQNPTHRHVALFTLGDSLALCRLSISASAYSGRKLDVGAYQLEEIVLIEVDAEGRRRRSESFATDRLGDAVARLYQRCADLLLDSPARGRAAATAGSVAALLGPAVSREERLREARRSLFAADVEATDHRTVGFGSLRGADAVLRAIQSLRELSDDIDDRMTDVLDLRADALLMRWTTSGTIRASGGAFAQDLCMLWIFGADGLATRWEQFDAEQEAEALARFDELILSSSKDLSPVQGLAAEPSVPRHVRPRVRPNAATVQVAELDAAVAAGDADALALLLAEDYELIDHTTGTNYGRSAQLHSYRRHLRTRELKWSTEPLATLGDSLALCHLSVSGSGAAGPVFDVGAFEVDRFTLIEVDARRRRRRAEVFAPDHLGDAVARLYERYAELLPEGPPCTRAAATARAIAALPLVAAGAYDLDRCATAFAPGIEYLDHRTVGPGPLHGAEAVLQAIRALLELSEHLTARLDDILALRSDAFLVRWTDLGTDRASGGAFERCLCQLFIFGVDGLLTRTEQFDGDRAAEALARFDELTAEPLVPRQVTRRVRPNSATAHSARFEAAIAARAVDVIADGLSELTETVNHRTGATYGRDGLLTSIRGTLASARDLAWREQPLASLGDSLALLRMAVSASGLTVDSFDVGAMEDESITLSEVDAHGRGRRFEVFAPDHLGNAVARLYERYADLLPDGPERDRAAATARSVAAMLFGQDGFTAIFAPAVECVDHRILGTWSARGAEAVGHHFRSLLEVAADVAVRVEDVLGLRFDAYLLRSTNCGTDRASGGAYERPFLILGLHGADGLLARLEYFDPDRHQEALARFDELVLSVSASPAGRIENDVTRLSDRFAPAWAARDWEGIAARYAPEFRLIDRRRYAHLELDRDQHLASLRFRFEMSSSRTVLETIATRGRRLALIRQRFELAGGDVGPSETESLNVAESGEHGTFVLLVTFDPDALDAAYAELDARYGGGEAAPYATTLEVLERLERNLASRDWEELSSALAADFVVEDHRLLGFGRLSRDEYLPYFRALVELAPDVVLRTDHVVALSHRGILAVVRWLGSREGGPFETPIVGVTVLDSDGRISQCHAYDPEQLDAARALYDELTSERRIEAPPDPLRIPPNAATRAGDRNLDAMEARDWEAVAESCAPSLVFEDRRRLIRTTAGRDMFIANCQWLGSRRARAARTVLATAGDRLALVRLRWTAAADAPPFEVEQLGVWQVDTEGPLVAVICFDPDERGAASAEMLERYARSGADEMPGAWFEFWRAWNDHDLGRLRTLLLGDFFFHDHRRTGIGRVEGEAYLASLAALYELSPDVRLEPLYSVAGAAYGHVDVMRWVGTNAEGGEFESVFARLMLFRGDQLAGLEQFELEDLDVARARLAELRET